MKDVFCDNGNKKLEYIFLDNSLNLMHRDLKKLSQLTASLSDEECYSVMVKVENIKHDIEVIEEVIRKKVLGN